jgi:phage terminase large subunit-like protein
VKIGDGVQGRPRKSLEEHLRDGTYRADRHGKLGPDVLDFRPKPPGKITASVRSQSRWVRNAADEYAVREGCRFNEPLAEHVCEFFPTFLRHSQGRWAGDAFDLTDWQKENIFYPLFGWVREDGLRRFRQTYIERPKKNYKSSEASGIGLYGLVADEEIGAEIYSFGADKDQARVVHDEAVRMVEASPDLAAVLKINYSNHNIAYKATGSFYRALSASPRGKHGPKPHFGIGDELHEWYGDGLWNSLRYAFRMRTQPLFLIITNAGDDLQSICYQQREKAIAVRDGHVKNTTLFVSICAADSRQEAEAEVQAVCEGSTEIPVAERCNPALGHVVSRTDLINDMRDTKTTPRELPNLLRLTYGIWDIAAEPAIAMPEWEACGDEYTEGDLIGMTCWAGLDLAPQYDLSALGLVFDVEDGTFRQHCYFWLPEETARKRKHLVDFIAWERDGWIRLFPEAVTDYDLLHDDLKTILDRFQPELIHYDKAYAEPTAQWLEETVGIKRVEFPQHRMRFTGPTKEYLRRITAGTIRHNRNPILTWQASHVQTFSDANNNERPIKPNGAMLEGTSIYDEQDVREISW